MPELPEVETTVNFLRSRVLGSRISDVRVGWPRLIANIEVGEFLSGLRGFRITELRRRGKFVKFVLTKRGEHKFLYGHMRMSGSFDVVSQSAILSKHDHVVFDLGDKREIRFNDPRKFGRFYLVESEAEIDSKLGLEPLASDLKPKDFADALSRFKKPIKTVLLDQSVVAGVGNIYADESLWASCIHPLRKADKISEREYLLLFRNLRRIFRQAIKANGTDFGDGVVEGGIYKTKVYGREDKDCQRCKAKLERLIVGQRGTTVCARCQVL